MRILVWFSCGVASAVAAKMAVEKYGDKAEIFYCDTSEDEHEDNPRFRADVEKWIDREIKVLKNPKYSNIFDVFDDFRYLVKIGKNSRNAQCTIQLKKMLRHSIEFMDDIQVFGFTGEPKELDRRKRAQKAEPEIQFDFILGELTKEDCFKIVRQAGIELPAMYKMGYPNNNCRGCVKVESVAYWQHIRRDWPDRFKRMAQLERKFDFALNRTGSGENRKPIFLDELPEGIKPMRNLPNVECGVLCQTAVVDRAELEAGAPEGGEK